MSGESELPVAARKALLDALEALDQHRDALVLVGAQAIFLHANGLPIALAATTKDSDVAIDPRALSDDPLIEEAMRAAGFHPHVAAPQPGSWVNDAGVPVDLMVPSSLSASGGTRGARIPPHGKHATRRAAGLEAALVDRVPMMIEALDPTDGRAYEMKVAGPAALLVAKLHKLGERQATPDRMLDKDAHDLYRLLVAVDTPTLAARLSMLLGDSVAGQATETALVHLAQLFARGPDAQGSMMAGRAESLVGDPPLVAAATAALASDVLVALGRA